MTSDDLPRFTEAFWTLCQVYGQEYRSNPLVANAYFTALVGLDVERVIDAMTRAIRESALFPTPAMLREFAGAKAGAAAAAYRSSPPAPPMLADLRRHGGELASVTADLIERRLAGRLTNAQYIAEMRGLETRFPGIGWAEKAAELELVLAGDREARLLAARSRRPPDESA